MSLNALIMMVVFGGFLSVSLVVYLVLAPQLMARARLRRRISAVSGKANIQTDNKSTRESGKKRGELQARLKQAEKDKAKTTSRTAVYRRDLQQAGLSMSLQKFFLLCGGLGLLSGAVYLLLGYPPIGVVPVMITAGFGLPRFVVRWLGKRRVNKFTQLFADAVDVMVRGIKSGLPVGECLNIIARESPDPVGEIFREIVEAQRLGVTTEEALERAQDRMPTAELRFFSIVLSIQQQTGGNLAETLKNLSGILRARKKMKDKVHAMSSEARASAMIIGSLPFLVTGLLTMTNADYIMTLFTDDVGKVLVVGCLVWMGLGIFIMKQMVNFEI